MDKKVLYAGGAALALYFLWVGKSASATPSTATRTGSVSAPGTGFANPVTVNVLQGSNAPDKTTSNPAPKMTITPDKTATGATTAAWAEPVKTEPSLLDNIRTWMANNLGASDFEIRKNMDKYGVKPVDMVAALGGDLADVQRRYDAAAPVGTFAPMASPPTMHENIRTWMANNLGASDFEIRKNMDKYGVKPADMVFALGGDLEAVQKRYDSAI